MENSHEADVLGGFRAVGGDEDGRSTGRRPRLWELGIIYHCPIIGTCLSLSELRRLGRKLKLREVDEGDYELHVAFVHFAGKPGKPAKFLEKLLDQKYAGVLRRFGKVKTEAELRTLWLEADRAGDIPGAFWAALSHPLTTEELRRELFGRVHMLSHLVGASGRAELTRLADLEKEVDGLSRSLGEARDDQRLRAKAAALRIESLERENLLLNNRLAASEAQKRDLSGAGQALARMTMERETWRIKADGLEREVRVLRMERAGQIERIEAQHRELTDLRLELDRLEAHLTESVGAGEAATVCPKAALGEVCPCPEGAGACVLYVGGRTHLAAHYKRLVEDRGGRFLHHDGGDEASTSGIAPLLSKADVVFCPVDCVSHAACERIKTLCAKCRKPYKMLRSSGLSTLLREFSDLAGCNQSDSPDVLS